MWLAVNVLIKTCTCSHINKRVVFQASFTQLDKETSSKFSHRHFTSFWHFTKMLKYFNYFQNWNFSVLWLNLVLSFMTKVNPNKENGAKLDIFSWDIFKSDIIFHWQQNTKIFQWLLQLVSFNFIINTSTKKLKWNKIKPKMCKSDSIFINLQSSTVFKWLLKFISW